MNNDPEQVYISIPSIATAVHDVFMLLCSYKGVHSACWYKYTEERPNQMVDCVYTKNRNLVGSASVQRKILK